jgi:PAS domain S-box-containing protein
MGQEPATPFADLNPDLESGLPELQELVRAQSRNSALASNDSFEGWLQAILQVLPAHTWYAAPDGALTFVNKGTADYLGLPMDHPLRCGVGTGAAWDSHIPFLHPDDHEEARRVWSNCLRTVSSGQLNFRVRDGRGNHRWFISCAQPLLDAGGKLLHWVGINVDIEERRQVEFYLAEGQRLAHTGSWAFDTTGFTYWSHELFAIHDLKPEGKAPTTDEYLALVHPEDRKLVARQIETMLAQHGPFDFTKRILRPDGAIRYVRCVGAPATDGPGFVGTGIDVTEQEELTQALRGSEEGFRLLVDGLAAQVSTMTPAGELEFVNQQVLDYFGKPLQELKGWHSSDVMHPEDRPRVMAALGACLQSGEPYEHEKRLRRFDGVYHWFRAHGRPARDPQGRIVRWYIVLTDIEERKKAEAALAEQQKELQQLVDLAPQMVAVFGPHRERLYTNGVALGYLGTTLEEWQRQAVGVDLHPDDAERVKAAAARGLATRTAYDLEVRIRKADGTYRWFLARYNPMRVDQGRPSRWYVACTDIEDRKQAEERLQQENVALREEIDKTSMFEEIVGASTALMAVLSRVSKVAASESTVLITGETGTGKELVARAIHRRSGRSAKAFVAVNCAAIPRDLIASELFGHEKGAFTGALQRRLGRFELANGGTIFLDEVAELSPDSQAALLRVIQERELEHVGGSETIHVDVRVIAATNRDLVDAVANGSFRQDLFYRLNVFPLEMPSLRDRKQDIPVLVEYFIHRFARKAHKTFRCVNRKALERLQSYPWPGNVRELQNVIERSVIVCETDEFTVDESWLSTGRKIESAGALSSKQLAYEKAMIEEALRESDGQVFGPAGAAARLRIPRSTLESRIRALRINKGRFRPRPPKDNR